MKIKSLIALSCVAVSGVTALAAPIATTSYGGHSYELWESPGISWSDANLAATGAGGYLATLTDASETSAVFSAFIGTGYFQPTAGQASQAWLGGYTTDPGFTTTDPTHWAWVTGEAWNAFSAGNFAGGEPNGDSSGLAINRYGTPEWNDEGGFVGGYIVEKGAVGVPDGGSTLALLGGATLLLGAIGRRLRG